MVKWKIIYTKDAAKDSLKIAQGNLKEKTEKLLKILALNPLQNPPTYEKLVGDLEGFYSRRITVQHRLVYQIIKTEKIIKVVSMWSHYE